MSRYDFKFPTLQLHRVSMPEKSLLESDVKKVILQINASTGRKNQPSASTQKKRLAGARLLVQGLYQSHDDTNPQAALIVPASSGAYKLDAADRVSVIGHKIAPSVVNTLEALGWVKVTTGGRFGDQDVPTIIRPTGALLQRFEAIGKIWQKLKPPPPASLIRLKNYDPVKKESFYLKTPESDPVRRMRADLNKINKFIATQAIGLMVTDAKLKKIASKAFRWHGYFEKKRPAVLNLQSVFLRRVFVRSRFEFGGRLYGAWWQTVPKEARVHITINGMPTVEIDYSALHPAILYHRAGLELPQGDLYDIGLRDTANPTYDASIEPYASQRPIIKQYVNAKLNDLNDVYRLKKKDQAKLGITLSELRKRVEERLPEVAKHFGTDIGLRLQRIDSDIAVKVMLKMQAQGIAALAIHDSFLVDITERNALMTAMTEAYFEVVGQTAKFKSKTLFDNDKHGQRIVPPEFPILFTANGEVDGLAIFKTHEGSKYSKFMASYRAREK